MFGMSIPAVKTDVYKRQEEVIVTAVEKSASYPWSTIMGIIIEPIEAVSAAADPEMPPKK